VKRACLVVCVSVCLSVGEHISGKKHPLFIILCTLPVVVVTRLSPLLAALRYVLPVLRTRDDIFAHKAGNKRRKKAFTQSDSTVGDMGLIPRRIVKLTRQEAAPDRGAV